MPATVLAERVGWTGSIRWFRENVKRLRPERRPPDPADRIGWAPGDAAQCDLWFPPRKIPLEDPERKASSGGTKPPAAGYSPPNSHPERPQPPTNPEVTALRLHARWRRMSQAHRKPMNDRGYEGKTLHLSDTTPAECAA